MTLTKYNPKIKNMKIRLFSLLVTLFFFSCSSPIQKIVKEQYGSTLDLPKIYVYVPSGTLNLDPENTTTINGFFMSKFEVTNIAYQEFLAALNRQGRTKDLEEAKPKLKENIDPAYGEPYVPFYETYLEHPAYHEYPVVAISKKGAELYCEWLTNILQESNPNFQIKARLPLELEWIYAARGGHQFAPYPWGGYYYRNAKGQFLANFKRMEGGNITYDRKNNKYEIITGGKPNRNYHMTAPVASFIPNDFGLYHMSGNVAEMIFEPANNGGIRTKGGCYDSTARDIQINGRDEFDGWLDPSQYVGFRPLIEVQVK